MLRFWKKQWRQGRAIYGDRSWRESRRTLLHTVRSLKNKQYIENLEQYFATYTAIPDVLKHHVGFYELLTRFFLFKESAVQERLQAVQDHFDAIAALFTPEALRLMYIDYLADPTMAESDKGIVVWHDDELQMKANLYYHAGQRKEGFLTLLLTIAGEGIYHVNFRFGRENGKSSLIIGTVQGYKAGLDNAKKATKKMYGYRPKNFIMFLVRMIAQVCNVSVIYAVSDAGFYANTHLVRGHKAKVAVLDALWEESGGTVCEDPRFYQIPLEEHRKPIEEIKSQKRNQYRNRYALLDSYEQQIGENMSPYMKRR